MFRPLPLLLDTDRQSNSVPQLLGCRWRWPGTASGVGVMHALKGAEDASPPSGHSIIILRWVRAQLRTARRMDHNAAGSRGDLWKPGATCATAGPLETSPLRRLGASRPPDPHISPSTTIGCNVTESLAHFARDSRRSPGACRLSGRVPHIRSGTWHQKSYPLSGAGPTNSARVPNTFTYTSLFGIAYPTFLPDIKPMTDSDCRFARTPTVALSSSFQRVERGRASLRGSVMMNTCRYRTAR